MSERKQDSEITRVVLKYYYVLFIICMIWAQNAFSELFSTVMP